MEEDEWDSPRIVRYLNALSHDEIETIKQLAKPNVSLSQTPQTLQSCAT